MVIVIWVLNMIKAVLIVIAMAVITGMHMRPSSNHFQFTNNSMFRYLSSWANIVRSSLQQKL